MSCLGVQAQLADDNALADKEPGVVVSSGETLGERGSEEDASANVACGASSTVALRTMKLELPVPQRLLAASWSSAEVAATARKSVEASSTCT